MYDQGYALRKILASPSGAQMKMKNENEKKMN